MGDRNSKLSSISLTCRMLVEIMKAFLVRCEIGRDGSAKVIDEENFRNKDKYLFLSIRG